MPREQEYRARAKKTHKMTRDGLVEHNAATGEEIRVSGRGKEFDLRAQEAARENVSPAPASLPKSNRTRQQAADFRQASGPDARGENPRPSLRDAPGDKGAKVSAPDAKGNTAPKVGTASPGKLQFSKDEAPPEAAGSNSLGKKLAQKQARLTQQAAAKAPPPTEHKAATQAAFQNGGEKPGRLQFEGGVPKAGKKPKKVTGKDLAAGYVHSQVRQAEDGNVATEAAHRAEQKVETAGRSALRFHKTGKAAKAQKAPAVRQAPGSGRAVAGKAAENPAFKSNPVSRFMQKQRQKRQYAKAARQAKQAGTTFKKASGAAGKVLTKAAGVVTRHPAVFLILGGALLLLISISSLFTSVAGMFSGGMGTALNSTYLAPDADIDDAELAYTEWETDLQLEIAGIEAQRPGYDEYRYQVADIGHNPFELMAYLTAVHGEFSYSAAEADLRQIFGEQYQLSVTEEIEIRYREVPVYDAAGVPTGETTQEPYEWRILNINLAARSFSGVVAARMDGQQEQHYSLLLQSRGNRQHVASPFPFNWLPNVTDYYGYRVHPISGEKDYHKAADIALPLGTEILAAHDGVVQTATSHSSYGNYIVLDGSDGITTKYAHCQTLLVSAGQTVKAGDVIAKVGSTGESTGAHLHFELLKDGRHLNPLYFTDIPGGDGGNFGGDPGAPMGDGSFEALLAEAQKHIGKPYVFGASGPDYFDCSGFVCWCLNQSGVASVGRTTAQGLYNMCTPVSSPQPGDLVFFHSTYSTPNTVTHVGIYVGNGQMIHCGDPIGYANLNTSYWQQHFYAYGRIN